MDVFFFLRSKIPLQFFFASIMLEHPLHRRKITICIHDIFMIHFKSNIFLRGKNKSLLFKTESESHQHYKNDKIPLNVIQQYIINTKGLWKVTLRLVDTQHWHSHLPWKLLKNIDVHINMITPRWVMQHQLWLPIKELQIFLSSP